jgi:hypothetical protein
VLGTRLWWRRGSSLAVLAVAVAATTTAVVGPVYAAAAGESSLRQVLRTAPADESGLHVQTTGDITVDPFSLVTRTLPAGFTPAYDRVVETLQLPTPLQGRGAVPSVVTRVVWRDGACAHLRLSAGRCPRGDSEVIASLRTAGATWGVTIGATIELPGLPHDTVTQDGGGFPEPLPAKLTVVGLYVPHSVDDPFWFGHDYFDAHPGSGPGGEGPDTIDDVFVDRGAMDAASAGTAGLATVDYYLDPSRVERSNVAGLRAAVARAQRQFPATDNPTLTTQLDDVLDRATKARSGLDGGTAAVTVQLLLLAWLVLFEVVLASSESRASEVAIAKLRGLPPRSVAVFALGEPLALVALAAPLGLLCGWLATRGLASTLLAQGVPVRLTPSAFGAAALAVVGGGVAAALATRRLLTRSVLDQWRRAEEQVSRGRTMAVLDVVVAAAAIATVVALQRHSSASTHPGSALMLGPALLVLAVALLGLRLLPGAAGSVARMTRASRHLGMFLATRQVARRASEHRFAALLAVAAGMAVFSVAANNVVRHNELTRAEQEVGADRVVAVEPGRGVDVADVVRRVDPAGRWAMAAAAWSPIGGSVGVTIQAVDLSRLPRIGYFDSSLNRHLPRLSAHVARSVTVVGDALRATVAAQGKFGDATFDVSVADTSRRTTAIVGPVVRAGAHQIVVPVPCSSGCHLVGFGLDRAAGEFLTMKGTWSVAAVQVRRDGGWRPLDAQLSVPAAWRAGHAQTQGTDTVTTTPNATSDTFVAEPGGWPSIELADVPRPLPVLLTADATDTPTATPFVSDLARAQIDLVRVATVDRVPRLLGTGGLADLTAARAALPAFDQLSRQQVWLGRDAPPDALAQLQRAGLAVGTPDSVREHVRSLRQQGPALALQLFLFASFACTALALAATVLALAAAGRRRSFELAALRTIGVRRRSLLGACLGEQLILLGTGLLLGVVPGLIAARVALPHLAEFADTPPTPLSYAPSTVALLVFAASLSVAVVVAAVVGGVALLRAAAPSRLREASP